MDRIPRLGGELSEKAMPAQRGTPPLPRALLRRGRWGGIHGLPGNERGRQIERAAKRGFGTSSFASGGTIWFLRLTPHRFQLRGEFAAGDQLTQGLQDDQKQIHRRNNSRAKLQSSAKQDRNQITVPRESRSKGPIFRLRGRENAANAGQMIVTFILEPPFANRKHIRWVSANATPARRGAGRPDRERVQRPGRQNPLSSIGHPCSAPAFSTRFIMWTPIAPPAGERFPRPAARWSCQRSCRWARWER